MAHELDTNIGTGRLAYFGVKKSAWHGEGFTVDAPPSFNEALRLAGADYDVMLRPLHVDMPGGLVKSPMGKATVRIDRNEVLGIVGDDYRPIQNRDAFQALEPLIDSGLASIETGGTLRDGADAWLMVQFNIDSPIVREVFAQEVIPYAIITTNHTGRRKVVCMETPIRVVCANTLTAALKHNSRAVAVSHRGDGGTSRVIEASQDLFAGLVERYASIAESFKILKERVLTVEQFTASVLDTIAPMPTDSDAPRFKSSCNRALDRRQALTASWEQGIGHVGNHSAWEAYNGAVEVIDHNAELFRIRGSRASSLMDGTLSQLKVDTLEAILAVK